MSFNLQVSIRDATVAQCAAPPSERLSAIGRMERSTVLLSNSTRPSSMKRVRPSQRDRAYRMASASLLFWLIRPSFTRSHASSAAPRLEAVHVVDMSASNSWAEFAGTYRRARPAYQEHEGAKVDLKKLVPEDAREATGHSLRAKRSKSGAISFDLVDAGLADAPLQ
jgi:hypothetical protein